MVHAGPEPRDRDAELKRVLRADNPREKVINMLQRVYIGTERTAYWGALKRGSTKVEI